MLFMPDAQLDTLYMLSLLSITENLDGEISKIFIFPFTIKQIEDKELETRHDI